MQAQTGTEATLARAESLKDQGRMTEAIVRYREFVATDPEHFDGQRKLGAALLESGALNDALPPLERAVALQPKSAAAHYSLGFGLMQLPLRSGGARVPAGTRAGSRLCDGTVSPRPCVVGQRSP